jgi:hypothetical protein
MLTGSEENSIMIWDLNTFNIISHFVFDENAKGVDRILNNLEFSIDSINFQLDNFFLCTSRKRIAYYDLNEIINGSAKDRFEGFS